MFVASESEFFFVDRRGEGAADEEVVGGVVVEASDSASAEFVGAHPSEHFVFDEFALFV